MLQDDAAIAGPVFAWDIIHSIQEVLKEGMHPRLSGLGAAPCGLIAAAMPAVGCFHFNDPEYAYLDGVELASVAQPRLGADWAALCAAAIAAAFNEAADPEMVVDTVLKLAQQNNKEIFYQINTLNNIAGGQGSDEEFARWWMTRGGQEETNRETGWIGPNPLRGVLPLLRRFHADPRKLLALAIAPESGSWYDSMLGGHVLVAIIAAAAAGALHGAEIFPAEWRAWAEPQAAPWFALTTVVEQRLAQRTRDHSRHRGTGRAARGRQHAALRQSLRQHAGRRHRQRHGLSGGRPHVLGDRSSNIPQGISGVLEPKRLESEDDNQMAMHLVETYLEREGLPVMARHFGRTWQERLNRDHFYALCMGNAYDMICAGWDPRITGHWSVVTGSTVMCMEPVGVFHLADPEYAAIDATAISYMYQRGLDNVAATMLAATVAEAFRPQATVDSVLQAALHAAPKSGVAHLRSAPLPQRVRLPQHLPGDRRQIRRRAGGARRAL